MLKIFFSLILTSLIFSNTAPAGDQFETDTIKTTKGNLKITFIGHGSLMFDYQKKIIHVDPFSKLADYTKLPKADLILITHDHYDHLDKEALEKVRTKKTEVVITKTCVEEVKNGIVMKNGDVKTVKGFKIEAVPAYNLVHKRDNGKPFHTKGIGNGYIITFHDKRVYIAGDTENIPEMKDFKEIDIAFLPMNLPYTMTPEMVADVVKMFRPKILYPYHFGETDTDQLLELLKEEKDIEVRIRKMK